MKKKKVIIYSVILVLLVTCFGLGLMAMLMGNQYKNNKVTFKVEDGLAYSKIEAKYYYNNQENVEKAYGPKYYTPSSDLNYEPFAGFETWNIGDSVFNSEYEGNETFKYEIVITNLNTEKALSITLSDVAVGNKMENNRTIVCFYTKISYAIDGGVEEWQFNNKAGEEVNTSYYTPGNTSVDIGLAKEVPVGSQIKITIELERKTLTEQFAFVNNFKVNIATAI